MLGIRLTNRRTLAVATPPQSSAMPFAITLPALARITGVQGLPQQPQIDLATDLCGVEARWQAASGNESWTGWLPHLDLAVAREFTAASAEHARLWPLLQSR